MDSADTARALAEAQVADAVRTLRLNVELACVDVIQATESLALTRDTLRTFEDLAATGSLASFLTSFRITGTNDPMIQLQARMRFIAFTAQFVEREYDPLGF